MSSIVQKIQDHQSRHRLLVRLSAAEHPARPDLDTGSTSAPSVLLIGPGGASQWFYDMFGGALEGCHVRGCLERQQLSGSRGLLREDSRTCLGGNAANIDFWGALEYRGQLEMFQQAIEKAGTLDQAKIAEVLRTEHFADGHGRFLRSIRTRSSTPPPTRVRSASGRTVLLRSSTRATSAPRSPIYPETGVAGPHCNNSGSSDRDRFEHELANI